MRTNQGFTLVELLVVLLIAGIALSFAFLAFGDFGLSRRISMAADQFINTLLLAEQQAILESSTLGVFIKNDSYQIYRFQSSNTWQPLSSKGLLGLQHFPANTKIQLKTNKKPGSNVPEIIISSSGELTPFQLSLGSLQKNPTTIIIGQQNGLLSIADPKG